MRFNCEQVSIRSDYHADNVVRFSTVEESQFIETLWWSMLSMVGVYLTTFQNLTALLRTNKIWFNCGYISFNWNTYDTSPFNLTNLFKWCLNLLLKPAPACLYFYKHSPSNQHFVVLHEDGHSDSPQFKPISCNKILLHVVQVIRYGGCIHLFLRS